MRLFPSQKQNPHWRRSRCCIVLFASLALLGTAGCGKSVRTNDPQLKPVQELLDAQLPPGTSEDRVKAFLVERGYVVLPSQRPGTVAAIIPTAENRQGSPRNAQVTFYFDASGRLNTFALERASGIAPKQ